MASSRITCPDCKSVLKPAKPVPDGKKVKCPKCGETFTTPGLVEEEQRPRAFKASTGKAKTSIKKASSIKKTAGSKPAPKKPMDDDDDGSGAIYGTIKEREKTEEEEEETNIEYAPDMSIKDLRGPAQAAVVQPSNYMLLISGLSCLGDILIICFCFWPMVFSEHLLDHDKVLDKYYRDSGDKDAAAKSKGIPKERKDLKPEDLAIVKDVEFWDYLVRWIFMGVYILMLIYNAITCIGAVKMQNLESRGWGIASSIMTLLPFGCAGLAGVLFGVFHFLFAMLLDDLSLAMMYSIGVGTLVWIVSIAVGISSLRVLLSQEVIDGFEYVAE